MKKKKILKKKASRKPIVKAKKAFRRPKTKKHSLSVSVRENIVAYETAVERSKYPSAEAKGPFRELPAELPGAYGQDKITLVVRDPRWTYAYWEITPQAFDRVRKQLGEEFNRAKMALRVYDVTNIDFTGSNAHGLFDISINEHAKSWYIETGGPGKSFCADIGYLLSGGRFITIVRSNAVHTPIEGPSDTTDEEWMVPEEIFGRLYGMGFGMGRTSPVGGAWEERGIASMSGPLKKIPKKGEA